MLVEHVQSLVVENIGRVFYQLGHYYSIKVVVGKNRSTIAEPCGGDADCLRAQIPTSHNSKFGECGDLGKSPAGGLVPPRGRLHLTRLMDLS